MNLQTCLCGALSIRNHCSQIPPSATLVRLTRHSGSDTLRSSPPMAYSEALTMVPETFLFPVGCMIASKNTEKRGTGFGSKVVKDVVNAHKGKIEMDQIGKAHQPSLLDRCALRIFHPCLFQGEEDGSTTLSGRCNSLPASLMHATGETRATRRLKSEGQKTQNSEFRTSVRASLAQLLPPDHLQLCLTISPR